MILCFELSMPNNNAWNGKWSGEGRYYAKTINFGKSKKAEKHAQEILDNGSYYYNFGDGWGASVSVKQVTAKEAATARRKSVGFCGYGWMIDSIRLHGKIQSSDA